ncbi:MAG: cell division topological specificity factor MinE [Clostridia bacterium]|nr:cell division topological specificity factor MinE [Clostridia bacterium]
MGLFGKKRERSSSIAKDRLKLVLVYDRTGTSSNNAMIEMMKRDILRVISEYIEIDEDEFELDIKNSAMGGEGTVTSEIVANIPIKRIKRMSRNQY